MPVMDGPTAIADIRKLGHNGIILGLTGNALLSDREAMMRPVEAARYGPISGNSEGIVPEKGKYVVDCGSC